MFKCSISAGLLILLSTFSFADSDADLEKYLAQLPKPEHIIPPVVESYGRAIGCDFYFDPENIVEKEIDQKRSFIALFTVDIGCSGGNNNYRPVFVVLQYGAYDKIFISLKYSLPSQTSDEFPKDTQNIYIRDGKIRFNAKKFDPKKDALCCASIPFSGEVIFSDGKWNPISEN